MIHKKTSSKFAEITSAGTIASILGIGAISLLSRSIFFAGFIGLIGSVTGIVTLKMHVERLEKMLAGIGITLSIIPVVYALVTFF